jgi:hypothetical protein
MATPWIWRRSKFSFGSDELFCFVYLGNAVGDVEGTLSYFYRFFFLFVSFCFDEGALLC